MSIETRYDYCKEEILELIEQNCTQAEIVKKLHLAKSSFYKYCIANNIKPKKIGKTKYDFNKEQIAFIKKLYNDGITCQTIAPMIGCHDYVIRRLAKENNWINEKKYTYVFSQQGQNNFSSKNKDLDIKELNNLFIKECNKIMDEIDSLKFHYDYNFKSSSIDITEEQLNYIKDNYMTKSFSQMSKDTKLSVYTLKKTCYSLRLFVWKYTKRLKIIEDKAFTEDLKNKNMSSNLIAKKYGTSSSYINKIRKLVCGENFKFVFNPNISMTTFEYAIEELLNDNNLLHFFQYKIEKMQVDFLLSHKICIECNGEYWHKDTEKRDLKKYTNLLELGYRLIIIEESALINNHITEIEKDILSFYNGSRYEEIHKRNSVNAYQSGVNIIYIFANGEGYTKIVGIDNVRAKLCGNKEGVETIENK